MESQQSIAQKTAALKELHDSGVLTDQEYQQKMQQLKAGPAAAPAGAKPHASAGNAHVWHMKKVEVSESITNIQTNQDAGKMLGMTMLVPTDWTFQGRIAEIGKMDCNYTIGRFNVMTESPDKTSGVQVRAAGTSVWSQNRAILQQIDQQNRQPWSATMCPIEQPQSLLAQLTKAGSAIFPGGQAIGQLEPIPGLSDKLPAMLDQANQQLNQQAMQQRMPASHLSAEAGRLRFSGTNQGKPVEAWLIAMQTTRSDPAQGGTIEMTDIPMFAIMYAPPGQLDANEKMFSAMLESIQVNPQWTAYCGAFVQNLIQMKQQAMAQAGNNVSQIYANMAKDNAKAAADQAAIRTGTQNYANQIHTSVAANRAAALDHSTQQFSLHMGDQAIYTDPRTGHSVQMSNQYDHAWASTTGNSNEYILTDSPSFDPNGQVGSGQWTQMQQQR